jgi:alpha-galactosidase
MNSDHRLLRLDAGDRTLVVEAWPDGAPVVLHFGARLPVEHDLERLRPGPAAPRGAMPDEPVCHSMFPTRGFGWLGPPALDGHFDDGGFEPIWSAETVVEGPILCCRMTEQSGLSVILTWELSKESGVLISQVRVETSSSASRGRFWLSRLAALSWPVPSFVAQVFAFEGHWATEWHDHRFGLPPSGWRQTNRSGRTGFRGASFALLGQSTDEARGEGLLCHLGWSGSHEIGVEITGDFTSTLFACPHLEPGEVRLLPGESYTSPKAYLAWSADGIDGLSAGFHALSGPAKGPRPVHFNTWEAVYFDMDEAGLMALADEAAGLGIERFVVDDGWFKDRRSDTTSLGDWIVDTKRFPNGLRPVADHVRRLGMSFGLWVEPEMLSPVSDLARAQPAWALGAENRARPTMRNQWVLSGASDAPDYIASQLESLIETVGIDYLKWDFNRDVFTSLAPSEDGLWPSASRSLSGWLSVMDRLRARFPALQIEACSAGGARLDLGIGERAERFWPSDNTDPVARLRIMRNASLILPLHRLGNHVGASPNPITLRETPMAYRAAIAMFGWMGVEADPRTMSVEDRRALAAFIALHKRHRALIHSGRLVRLTDCAGWMVVGATEALALFATGHLSPSSPRVRLPGLPKGNWTNGDHVFTTETLANEGFYTALSAPFEAQIVHLMRNVAD